MGGEQGGGPLTCQRLSGPALGKLRMSGWGTGRRVHGPSKPWKPEQPALLCHETPVEHALKCSASGTSLVAQWLRIRLPMQRTRVRALVQEDPTCHGATKPVRHNY